MKKSSPRILTLDIETLPFEGYFWDIWEQNIGLDMITVEWTILSYAAKWLGEPGMIYEDTLGRGKKKVRDDKRLLKKLHKLLHEADIVIAQNGKRFDIRKINARFLIEGYKPYSPIRVIDTKNEAKRVAAVTSTRLEWLSKYLTDVPKSKHKKFPGFELWLEALKDNPSVRAEVRKYNWRDVVATEKLYLRLRPWIKSHPNLAAYEPGHGPRCPKCKSHRIQWRGYEVTQQSRFRRMQCTDCGGWSREKQTTIEKTARAQLLAN